jgi:heterodisulfide reductase subunit C
LAGGFPAGILSGQPALENFYTLWCMSFLNNIGRHCIMETYLRLKDSAYAFADEVSRLANFEMRNCYNCGKCTAGCPVGFIMDPPIHKIMELVQFGRREELLRSTGIWYCVSCETCSTRCPKECKPSKVVDVLREIALREKKYPDDIARILAFHEAFLESVRKTGRLHEIGMIRDYKLRTFNLFEDVIVGLKMLAMGKLRFFPAKVKDRKAIEKIFHRFCDNK